jgi:iron complex transport system permease protein
MISLVLALLGVFLLSLFVGSVRIPLDEILGILLGATPERETWTTIVWKFRLPKAVTAVLAGSALSVSGLQMQTMFRNPLAGPFVLGINSGASLGVALVVLAVGTTGGTLLAGLGLLSDFGIVVAASLGAGLVLFLVLGVARRVETMTLLILGLMFGYATSALVSVLLYFSIAERIQAYNAWT